MSAKELEGFLTTPCLERRPCGEVEEQLAEAMGAVAVGEAALAAAVEAEPVAGGRRRAERRQHAEAEATVARGRRAAKAAWWSEKCQGHGAPRLHLLPEEWAKLEAESGWKGTAAVTEAAEEAEATAEADAAYTLAWDKWRHCGAELDAGFEMYKSAGEGEF